MIGGRDIIFPAVGDAATLEGCARIVTQYWPKARFENAVTGDKFERMADIPFGQVQELLAYVDAEAEAAWDADDAASPENSMLNLIVRPQDLTIIVDDPGNEEMKSMIGEIHDFLCGIQKNRHLV